MTRRTTSPGRAIGRLEDHSNLSEVLEVLARLPHVQDEDLPRLAESWDNGSFVASARARSLTPDSPLICEVLSAFDAVSALFVDDVRGYEPYITVDPAVTLIALKAVRDAVAGAYARPVLTRAEHAALLRPWRSVYRPGAGSEPDLGPQSAQVQALLTALPRLATRCHDAAGRDLWEGLVDQSFVAESERDEARASAFSVAVLTRRRRLWALVRRSGAEGIGRPCSTCRVLPARSRTDRDTERVLSVCLDAACALLVADALPDALTEVLTAPVRCLVPAQRRPL